MRREGGGGGGWGGRKGAREEMTVTAAKLHCKEGSVSRVTSGQHMRARKVTTVGSDRRGGHAQRSVPNSLQHGTTR